MDHSSGNFRFPGPYYMHKADLERYYHTKAENNFVFVEEGFVSNLGGVTAQVVEVPGVNMAAAEARVQLYYLINQYRKGDSYGESIISRKLEIL